MATTESVAQQQVLAALNSLRAERGDRFAAATSEVFGKMPPEAGVSKSTVDYHLSRLAEAGLFEVIAQGKGKPRLYVFSNGNGTATTAKAAAGNGVQTTLTDPQPATATEAIADRLNPVSTALTAFRKGQDELAEEIRLLTDRYVKNEEEFEALIAGVKKGVAISVPEAPPAQQQAS